MAYVPPLNGGRINATISGNTAGAGTLISTGNMVLAGGNNITLSQNGQSITISGANAPSGSINFSAGTTSNNLASVTFANSNNISFGLNGSTITGSVAAQSAQTLGLYATGANTVGQSSSSTMDARSLNISGQGALSAGLSGSTLQLSAPATSSLSVTGALSMSVNGSTVSLGVPAQSNQTVGFTAGTAGGANTSLTSNGTFDVRSMYLNAYGNISAGFSSSSMFLSATQSNQALSGSNGSFTFQTATFGNLNGMSFYSSNGSMVGSYTVPTQSAQTLGLYATGANTVGQSSSSTMDARSLNISGQGAISAGLSGSTLQLSAPSVSSVNAAGIVNISSNAGNVTISAPAFSAGVASNSTVTNQMILTAGNNITLSQSTNATGATVTVSAANQSNQTVGLYGTGNTFNNTTLTADARSLSFSGMGNVSVGYSNGMVQISGSGGGGGVALYDGANSISSGTARLSAGGALTASINGQTLSLSVPGTSSMSATGAFSISTNGNTISMGAPAFSIGISSTIGNTAGTTGTVSNQLILAGGNNITLSQSTGAGGNTITISGPNALTSQSNQALSASNGSFAFQTASFSNANGISFSTTAGSAIVASHNALTSQSNQALSGSNGSLAFQTATFGNLNGLSFYTSNGSMVGSYTVPTQSNQTLGLYADGNTIGTSSSTYSAQSLTISALGAASVGFSSNSKFMVSVPQVSTLVGVNGITISTNGGTISISGAGAGGGGGGGVALYDGANSISSGTARISAGGALTASVNGQTLSLNAPAQSSLVGSGGIVVSSNGSTITISSPATTLSRWEYPDDVFAPLGAVGNSNLSIQHMYVPFNVSGSAMKIGGSLNINTFTSNTTASVNISLWMGIYTLNGSTLSLATSGSFNNGFSWRNTASAATYSSSYMGMRQLTVPANINMTPGEYWIAAVMGTASTFTGMSNFTLYGGTGINNSSGQQVFYPLGADSAAVSNRNAAILFEGIYTTSTSAGPATIAASQINNTGASLVQSANFYNAIYNASY